METVSVRSRSVLQHAVSQLQREPTMRMPENFAICRTRQSWPPLRSSTNGRFGDNVACGRLHNRKIAARLRKRANCSGQPVRNPTAARQGRILLCRIPGNTIRSTREIRTVSRFSSQAAILLSTIVRQRRERNPTQAWDSVSLFLEAYTSLLISYCANAYVTIPKPKKVSTM